MHGYREPPQPQQGTTGGATCVSGAPNEIWSYGEECYRIMSKYLRLREKLRPYIRDLFKQAHEKGSPVIRTLFYEFPVDPVCFEIEDQYMFGDRYLCAPVLAEGRTSRKVYLPHGANWKQFDDGELQDPREYTGGQYVEVPCPLETMPVFQRS